jgi:3-aminobutyryl-CoA ammonia-lyase
MTNTAPHQAGDARPQALADTIGAGLVVVAGKRPARDVRDQHLAAQLGSALAAVIEALTEAGATSADMLHLRIYVTDATAYAAAGVDLRELLGGHQPPCTIVEVSGLLENAEVEIEALAAPRASSLRPARASGARDEGDGTTASLRLRLAPSDARYAGGLVAGSKTMELFADLETEIALREGGDEGLCVAYDMVEFLAPLRVGDFVEATARVVRRGRTSRGIELEVHKVLTVDGEGSAIPLPEPVLAARASVTIVVGRAAGGGS